MIPRVLAIAGVDPCGGAGLGLDARVIQVCGGFAATVPTCTTIQNRHGFRDAVPTTPDVLTAMLEAVAADAPLAAVKVGLCVEPRTVTTIAAWYARLAVPRPPLVVDPVLSATAGGGPSGVAEIAAALVARLVPLAAVVTPNVPELRELVGDDRPGALLERGAAAVLWKGGHAAGAEVVDRFVTSAGTLEFRHARAVRGPVHGTGCAVASALATGIARGMPLAEAAQVAVARVVDWIRATPDGVLPVPLAIH